ncbi:hypothetical protein Tco_0260986 [Tanacetum coccineum]
MIGFVRLPTVMMKLLSDNGNQEFGDFNATILGMLGTYDFEKRILDTARSLMEDDTYYTMTLLKRGVLMGMARETFFVVYVIVFLPKIPQPRVSSCPICMTKKKGARSKGNSTSVENGLYEILTNLDKNKRIVQVDFMPQLRLAPPAVYHEKVRKRPAEDDTRLSLATQIELTLEQSQQDVSDDVLVSIEAVEELKRNVWIKGEKKEVFHTT